MWRKRETGRPGPLGETRGRGGSTDTIGLLDSISLTAVYTDLTPPKAAPTTSAGDVLATVSSRVALSLSPNVVEVREPRIALWERVPVRRLAIGVGCLALLSG